MAPKKTRKKPFTIERLEDSLILEDCFWDDGDIDRPQPCPSEPAECPDEAECPHCRAGRETYRCQYFGRQYLYDIRRAAQLVQDGRKPVEVEEWSLRSELEATQIFREHLPHVETQFPGILAHVWFPLKSGKLASGHLLIDGNHRAARCLEQRQPFYAHLLTPQESYEILLRGPNLSRYWKSLTNTPPTDELMTTR